jgi:hypothetical protein
MMYHYLWLRASHTMIMQVRSKITCFLIELTGVFNVQIWQNYIVAR